MSRSDDPGHYFQTSDALATTERKVAKAKNKYGSPIRLQSKILAARADSDSTVFVAEAAGMISRVNVEAAESKTVFTQANAPLTCLAICQKSESLFTGCWNKTIYQVHPANRSLIRRFLGHNDFIKCLLTTSLNGKPILVSGGADAAIIVWDVESGKQLHKLKGHTKSLQNLALDPLSLPEGSSEPQDSFILFTASSDREIRRWHISLESAYELPESIEDPILAHDTSVYKLYFDSEGDLWTASADKTAKHLVRERDWEADTVLQHPDFVRDVVVAERSALVVTACRDEEVRVWDSASGDVICTFSGHYEEVTGLVMCGDSVISVSIDGSVRRWGLSRENMARYQDEVNREAAGMKEEADGGKGGNILTADEEAELAELMDDD